MSASFLLQHSLTQGAHSGPPPTAQAPSVTSLAGTRTERLFPGRIEQGLAAWRRLRELKTGHLLWAKHWICSESMWAKCPWECLPSALLHPQELPALLHGMHIFTPFYPCAKPGKRLVLAQLEVVSAEPYVLGAVGSSVPAGPGTAQGVVRTHEPLCQNSSSALKSAEPVSAPLLQHRAGAALPVLR